MQRSGKPGQPECDSHFPGTSDQRSERRESLRSFDQSGGHGRAWLSAEPAAFQCAQLSAVYFSKPELPESFDVPAAGISAVRLSAGEEFCLCLCATGEPERG